MNKNRLILSLLLTGVFLQTIPNLNLIGSDNLLFTTNFLSLLITFLLGAYLFYASLFSKLKIKQDKEGLLVLIFLLFQALSITDAITLSTFIVMFVNIASGVILYFITRNLIRESSTTDYQAKSFSLNTVILLGGIINILFQLSLLLYPEGTLNFLNYFLSKNLMQVTRFHYEINNKLYSNFPLEILAPILLLDFLTNNEKLKKISAYLYLALIFILVFASNFRYRLAGYFVSLTATLFLFRSLVGRIYKHIFIYSILLAYIFFNIFSFFNKTTIINRFTDPEELGKFSTISFRLKMYGVAFDLGRSIPFGVGLGNMYDYVQKSTGAQVSINKQSAQFSFMGGAHNIFFQTFAETGFFGLFSLFALLIYWLIRDLRLFRKGATNEKKIYSIMFWTLVFMNQFIPAYNTTFYIFFFLLRGVI